MSVVQGTHFLIGGPPMARPTTSSLSSTAVHKKHQLPAHQTAHGHGHGRRATVPPPIPSEEDDAPAHAYDRIWTSLLEAANVAAEAAKGRWSMQGKRIVLTTPIPLDSAMMLAEKPIRQWER